MTTMPNMLRSAFSWVQDLFTTSAVGPRPRDAALVLPFVALALAEGMLRSELLLPAFTTALTIAMIGGLPWRRRHPLLLLGWTTVLGAALAIVHARLGHDPVAMAAMIVLLAVPYSLFRHGTKNMRAVGGVVLAIGMSATLTQHAATLADTLVGLAVVGSAVLSGALVRERVAARARTLDMARAREREAVARDLHDTVAHHVTTIAIRAQVATAMPEDRAQVAESLAVIEREAQSVLAEMRALVRSLRDPSGHGAGAENPSVVELDPAPGIAQLESLADPGPPQVTVRLGASAGAGTSASTGASAAAASATAPGSLRETAEMPQIVRTTLFRIAQEGVTNARRHAHGAQSIEVSVRVAADQVVLEIRDDAPERAVSRRGALPGAPGRLGEGEVPTGGHGLIGMRERASLLGGTLEAGPALEGGWLLRAELPTAPAQAQAQR